jgi:alkaline phosphatase
MIGDGMGFEQVRMGRYVEVGKNGYLNMESSSINHSVMTHNINLGITDSAASATALATGVKTFNGRISIDSDGESVETILETALEMGKATGVISTTTIYHATPACFMSHVSSRGNYQEIVRQIVENKDVDILMGGGLEEFSTQQITEMSTAGYSYVTNKTALSAVSSGRLLGLFSQSHMPYETDRNLTETPSIAEMTSKSIEILQQNSSGFFLMVEGGRIDHASHDNHKERTIMDTIAFDKAVRIAMNYVETHENSILIVTADHETGGPSIISENLSGDLPTAGLTKEQNRTLRLTRVDQLTIDWSTGGHTRNHVPMYAFGNAFENISRTILIDNTDIFSAMNAYIHNEEIIFIDRTPINMVAIYYLYLALIPIGIVFIYVTIKAGRSIKLERKTS